MRDLEIGVGAGKQPAQYLEDRQVAEYQAGVALFGGQHLAAWPAAARTRRGRLAHEPQPPDGTLRADAAGEFLRKVAIMQCVIPGHAVPRADDSRTERRGRP